MRRHRKKSSNAVYFVKKTIALIFLCLTVAAVLISVAGGKYVEYQISETSKLLNKNISISKAEVKIYPLTVDISDLKIKDKGSVGSISAKRVYYQPSYKDILSDVVLLKRLKIDDIEIYLPSTEQDDPQLSKYNEMIKEMVFVSLKPINSGLIHNFSKKQADAYDKKLVIDLISIKNIIAKDPEKILYKSKGFAVNSKEYSNIDDFDVISLK